MSEEIEIIKELEKNGFFFFWNELCSSYLFYLNKKTQKICLVFDTNTGYFTKQFNSYFLETLKGKTQKNQLKLEARGFLSFNKSFPMGIITPSTIYLNGKFYTKTDYDDKVIFSKNFEDIENPDFIFPSKEESTYFERILKNLFKNNFQEIFDFMFHSIVGTKTHRRILFLVGGGIEKNVIGRFIEKIVNGRHTDVSPLKYKKFFSDVLSSRIAFVMNIQKKEAESSFFRGVKTACTAKSLLVYHRKLKRCVGFPINTFFVFTSDSGNIFDYDEGMEWRMIKVYVEKSEIAKEVDGLLANEEWVRKMRGYFYSYVLQKIPEVPAF